MHFYHFLKRVKHSNSGLFTQLDQLMINFKWVIPDNSLSLLLQSEVDSDIIFKIGHVQHLNALMFLEPEYAMLQLIGEYLLGYFLNYFNVKRYILQTTQVKLWIIFGRELLQLAQVEIYQFHEN